MKLSMSLKKKLHASYVQDNQQFSFSKWLNCKTGLSKLLPYVLTALLV